MVTEPAAVLGTVEGRIVADTIEFQMPYQRSGSCSGVVHGRSAIAEGGAAFGEDILLDDSCAGETPGTTEIRR